MPAVPALILGTVISNLVSIVVGFAVNAIAGPVCGPFDEAAGSSSLDAGDQVAPDRQ